MRRHKDEVKCVAFSGNEDMVLTLSDDSSIILWSTARGEQIRKPLILNDSLYSISFSADGTVIVSSSNSSCLCRWDAINGELLGESVSKERCGHTVSTDSICTKVVTWSEMRKTIRYWRVGPGGTMHETSTLLVSDDITACAIDMNHGVAAVGSANGAVGVSNIHEQFDSVGAV